MCPPSFSALDLLQDRVCMRKDLFIPDGIGALCSFSSIWWTQFVIWKLPGRFPKYRRLVHFPPSTHIQGGFSPNRDKHANEQSPLFCPQNMCSYKYRRKSPFIYAKAAYFLAKRGHNLSISIPSLAIHHYPPFWGMKICV